MARNKEALVLLLDVGPSMHDILPEVEKLCSMLIQKKFIYGKSDEVGVVIFGTEDTNNELTSEVGGYEHVVVLRNIKVVDGDAIEAVQQLPWGTVAGDFLDAIVVAMDMLIKKYGPTNKGKKRICLITDASCPIKDPYEGTKEDQVSTIADQMTAHGMKMDCIVAKGKPDFGGTRRVFEENDLLFGIFSKKTRTKTVYVANPTSILGAIRTRNISPVTIYRGDLEISPRLKIKVWVYKKTSEEKFPTLKKYSDKAPPTDKFATHEIKVDYEYKSSQDPTKTVPPEQRIKGYRYGPQVVPISTAEWDAVKFKPEKGVKLLGFTDASNILRHYYMKDVNIFIAEPRNEKAILAVSALARGMKEMNKVAIVRCVWRQGQANVVIGVLTPNVSDRESIPDTFYFNVLPFAEDVREFQFPSFSNLPSACQPNEKQQEAADNLVKMFDLGSDEEELLQPEFTPNPVLERFYRHLELKSKQPDAPVPPLDPTLKKITGPDPGILSRCQSAFDEFRSSFELKENPKLKKSAKRIRREQPSGSDDEGVALQDANDGGVVMLIEGGPSEVKVDNIGDSNPVQDFEAMMARRDGSDWVNKAIKDMGSKILDLVEDSNDGDKYQKAVECLISLRKGCIIEQEPKQFNDLLFRLGKSCREKGETRFSDFLASKGITLITKAEAPDSEVTEEEAKSFKMKIEPKSEQ